MLRLKPQPVLVSGMINRRLRSRETRQAQQEELLELRKDLRREAAFEAGVERALRMEEMAAARRKGKQKTARTKTRMEFEKVMTGSVPEMGALDLYTHSLSFSRRVGAVC